VRHKNKTRFYDFYVTNGKDYSFLIETDGEWFHPKEYSKSLNKIQKHNLKNDKLKNNIAKAKGIPLIRLREHDIKYNFNYIKSQILNEINRQKGAEQ
jgi:very-short-patch-repair endonuclease